MLGFEVALKPRLKSPVHVLLPIASRSLDHFGHENWDHQLNLAVAWNRVDIARSEIFTDERQWKVRLPGAALGRGCLGLVQTPALSLVRATGMPPPPEVEDDSIPVLGIPRSGPEGW